jgi:hypothetical protein
MKEIDPEIITELREDVDRLQDDVRWLRLIVAILLIASLASRFFE